MRVQQQPKRSVFNPNGKPKIEIYKDNGTDGTLSPEEHEKMMQKASDLKAAREKAQREGIRR
jgi:hypothetical protein